MFVEIVATFLIILITSGIYSFWIKPRRIMKAYVRELKNQGYKVLECPYNPFKNDLI